MLGITKTFNCTPEYALHEISFTNALLYSRAVPMPDDVSNDKDKPLYDDAFDANNPDNFSKFDDIEYED